MSERAARFVERLIGFLSALIFLAYAANFLYFFVDDEAIPFIYARHLLAGRGLTYNIIEGRVEGYTDFLHVLVDALILRGVTLVHAPLLTVFFIGKALSLLCGIAIVLVVWLALRRWRDIGPVPMLAGLLFLALAGPLAVWSCSSIETAAFALGTTVLAAALWSGGRGEGISAGLALAASIFLVLDRLDGPVLVGALLVPALVLSASARRLIWRRLVWPIVAVTIAYHAWRFWYFGTLLSTPLQAKVLFKLTPSLNLIAKMPARNYLLRFLDSMVWGLPLAAPIAAVALDRHDRRALGLSASVALLFLYAALVGDWMFGFRFLVPVLPLVAMLTALAVQKLSRVQRTAMMGAALACVLISIVSAARFVRSYEMGTQRPDWWTTASDGPARYFWPYYPIYRLTRDRVPAGSIVAYDQAGFIPFMLDVRNIDDLGIVSPFVAALPTSDVVYTEVGRYVPLTNVPVVEAAHAYVLHFRPQYIFAAAGLVRSANHDHTPPKILGDRYRFALADAEGLTDLYERTDIPLDEFDRPSSFLENVVHISHLQEAQIDGRTVAPEDFPRVFRYLYGEGNGQTITGNRFIRFVFSKENIPVMQLFAGTVRVEHPATVTFTLWGADGQRRDVEQIVLRDRVPRRVFEKLPHGLEAAILTIQIAPQSPQPTTIVLDDVRLQGQRPELTRYLNRMLPNLLTD
jgi:hypothetical protein